MKGDEREPRDEKRARGAAARRRAQMHLAQLSWLEGFEADGRWWVVGGEPTHITVTGLVVARARRTINMLRRDHAAALKDLLDDPTAWLATREAVLRHLGERVHGRAAAPEPASLLPRRVHAAALALEADHPALRPLIRAAASTWAARPGVLAAALRWMRPRARSLAAVIDGAGPSGLRHALSLAVLAGEDVAGTDALIALAAIDAGDVRQEHDRLANLIRRLRGSDKNSSPVPKKSAAIVLPWIDRLLAQEAHARERALALLAAVDLAAALRPVQAWEAEHAATIARAEALRRATTIDDGPPPEYVGRIIADIEQAKKMLPPPIPLTEILRAVDVLSEARWQPLQRAALRLLATLPAAEQPAMRPRFLAHAAFVATNNDAHQQTAWLWEALAAELSAGADARLLGPWNAVLEGGAWTTWVEHELAILLRRPADIRRFTAALARLARDGAPTDHQADDLAVLVAGGLDVEPATALLRRLEPLGIHPRNSLVRAAIALVGRDPNALAAVLRAMQTACAESETDLEEGLVALCEHATATGGAWLLVALLVRDVRRAGLIAELARFVPRRLWPPIAGAASRPSWIATYPPRLAEALARLAAVDPDAERTARRRTAPVLVERAAIVREREALRARGPLRPRQARRLANLESRLAAPRPPTAARLERLAARIDAAAVDVGAGRFNAALAEAARRRFHDRLGIEPPPDWTADRLLRSILLGLVELDPEDRTLARRLLQARGGPPPWDLRDDPVNRAFVARLSALGLDMSAWLDDGTRVASGGDGQPMELAFAHDPLQVFAMGAHFSTCLSPSGGNFFSVIANAADVNKRVLYARRDGKVIGRCLLALTDAGQVLTFHPYAHDKGVDFEAVVGAFAVELATRMKTRVASAGRVTTLLGRDWYDDGVRDLVGRYGPLEGRAFTKAAQEVPLASALALIVKTLGRDLDDLTLPVVVATTALERRPELILPLAPLLIARATLPEHTLIQAADLATRAGDTELADRLMLGPATRSPLQHQGAWTWGQVLARRRPSLALARLRQTRRHGVRGWDDEWGARLAVAALAMEQLRRPRQAAALYRRAIADEPWLKDEIGPRLAALEGKSS